MLSACSKDHREAEIKKCVAVAEKEVAGSTNESAEEHHDRIGDAVSYCMQQDGYVQDDVAMSSERCVDDVAFNANCYRLKQ